MWTTKICSLGTNGDINASDMLMQAIPFDFQSEFRFTSLFNCEVEQLQFGVLFCLAHGIPCKQEKIAVFQQNISNLLLQLIN